MLTWFALASALVYVGTFSSRLEITTRLMSTTRVWRTRKDKPRFGHNPPQLSRWGVLSRAGRVVALQGQFVAVPAFRPGTAVGRPLPSRWHPEAVAAIRALRK